MNAAFQRKLTTFRSMMQSTVSVTSITMIQDPMFPADITKKIPGTVSTTISQKIRLIRSKKSEENYIEDAAGFIPETFKWVLSLNEIQEGSTFPLFGLSYQTGKPEPLMFHNRIYGYRSPVNVRSS